MIIIGIATYLIIGFFFIGFALALHEKEYHLYIGFSEADTIMHLLMFAIWPCAIIANQQHFGSYWFKCGWKMPFTKFKVDRHGS